MVINICSYYIIKFDNIFIYFIQEISDPFYIFDVGDLVYKAKIWQQKLPRVKPFYGKFFKYLI